jgi:hypothetical protein
MITKKKYFKNPELFPAGLLRKKINKFGCASQEKQKNSECQSICNMWKVFTRPASASDF